MPAIQGGQAPLGLSIGKRAGMPAVPGGGARTRAGVYVSVGREAGRGAGTYGEWRARDEGGQRRDHRGGGDRAVAALAGAAGDRGSAGAGGRQPDAGERGEGGGGV